MDWFNNNNNLLLKIGFNSTVINNAIILSVEQLQLLPFIQRFLLDPIFSKTKWFLKEQTTGTYEKKKLAINNSNP